MEHTEISRNVFYEIWHAIIDLNAQFFRTTWTLLRDPVAAPLAYITTPDDTPLAYYNPYRYLVAAVAIYVTAFTLIISPERFGQAFSEAMQASKEQVAEETTQKSSQPPSKQACIDEQMHKVTTQIAYAVSFQYAPLFYLLFLAPGYSLMMRLFFRRRRKYFSSYFVLHCYQFGLYTVMSLPLIPLLAWLDMSGENMVQHPWSLWSNLAVTICFVLYYFWSTYLFLKGRGWTDYLKIVVAGVISTIALVIMASFGAGVWIGYSLAKSGCL